MALERVEGKDKGEILIYTLTTCGWCKKTKRFLKQLGVKYSYIDVDMLDEEESDRVVEEIKKWNPKVSFPTIVINNNKCIVGFDEEEIIKEIG